MRQALGLRNGPSGPQVPQRREAEQRGRRFVKDGEVPVVVVHSSRDAGRDPGADGAAPVNRIAAAESLARSERGAREQAERALAEAQTTIQHLRTQLVHAEMAHREALAAEQRAREAAEAALREANDARIAAEARAAESAFSLRPRRGRPRIVAAAEQADAFDTDAAAFDPDAVAFDPDPDAAAAEPAEPVRRRGRPRKNAAPVKPEAEQEPVQWWLPSFRAGRKR